jgi:hypothetical protein
MVLRDSPTFIPGCPYGHLWHSGGGYKDGRLGEPGSETERHRIALFFGGGGAYTADELRDRAVMLDMVESDVNLMSHDLEHLLQELLSQLMR